MYGSKQKASIRVIFWLGGRERWETYLRELVEGAVRARLELHFIEAVRVKHSIDVVEVASLCASEGCCDCNSKLGDEHFCFLYRCDM